MSQFWSSQTGPKTRTWIQVVYQGSDPERLGKYDEKEERLFKRQAQGCDLWKLWSPVLADPRACAGRHGLELSREGQAQKASTQPKVVGKWPQLWTQGIRAGHQLPLLQRTKMISFPSIISRVPITYILYILLLYLISPENLCSQCSPCLRRRCLEGQAFKHHAMAMQLILDRNRVQLLHLILGDRVLRNGHHKFPPNMYTQ